MFSFTGYSFTDDFMSTHMSNVHAMRLENEGDMKVFSNLIYVDAREIGVSNDLIINKLEYI